MTGASPTSSPGTASGPRMPRWLLVLGVPLLATLLIGFFVFLQFPFDRFRHTLSGQLGAALGADVEIAELTPALTLGGPGFAARGVAIRWPDGDRAHVEQARVRPAWSASWLTGRPALQLEARSDLGNVAGSVTLGAEPAFDGRLEAVALDRLPLDRFASGAAIDGTLDLEADLTLRERGPVGDAHFEARDGSLAAAQLPIALPYETMRGRVDFADDGSIVLEGVALEGPMISATAEGGTGPGPSPWLAPLDLEVHIEVSDRNLRPSFQATGLRLDRDGKAQVRVRGTLAAPVVR